MDAEDAREGCGGAGRGPWAGDRLPPGRRRDRREQLHPGARTHAGHDHAGPGRPRWRVPRLHDGRIPWPQAHGRQGPGAGRVGVAGPGEGCPGAVRQQPGGGGERRVQLHPGAGQGAGHDHEGPGRPRGRVLRLHDAGGPWPQAHGREDAGQGRVGVAGPGEDRARQVRQPPGTRRERRVQLHPGAGQGAGHDHAGPGRPRGRLLRLHVNGGAGPREHGRESPGADRVGVGGSGEGRSRAARQHRPGGDVGPDGRSRLQPERGRHGERASAPPTSPRS